ncbi:MAG: aminopeptidase P family protein [Hyphomicrobiaceae bacterium]|nr:aminopeptidase P family protein [Hyphomicrobiaceae bacterium]
MFQTFDAPASTSLVAPRIRAIRDQLQKRGLDAFLVPRADEHQNEYVPRSAERLAFASGFTGSAGLAVIALKSAALFVDGRYTVQAPAETDTTVFEVKGIRTTDLKPWLISALKPGSRIGFDPRLHTISEIESVKGQLSGTKLTLVPVSVNPVDAVWGKDRPTAPVAKAVVHPEQQAGQPTSEKLSAVQAALREAGHDALVLSATDSICWLFNIRGGDIPHNPVVLAHAIVRTSGKADLFIATEKVTPDVRKHVAPSARIKDPTEFRAALLAMKAAGKKVRLVPLASSWWLYRCLGGAKAVVRGVDPCAEMKSVKNTAEIAGARSAHVRDGLAVVRFLAWLDQAVSTTAVDEISAVQRLEAFRAETGALREISFPTISGSGPNGAIVHYRVSDRTNRVLQKGELFLIDSGGQYADGTTDITRTVAIGTPTVEMRERFTLVLKGMIAISMARFPKGTRGVDLDPYARRALWARGLNYDHGTGHGVGSYLNVHEGPASISKGGMAEIKPHMILSNEPGYYKAGAYGIRIENLILVTEAEPIGGDIPMMGFETLTLAPIDRRLIVPGLLSADEREWVDTYHGRVRDQLSSGLDVAERRWLAAATATL